MTAYALLTLVVLALVVGALERRRRDDSYLAQLERQAAAHEAERAEWTRERQLLLNRIKPETAQYVAPAGPAAPAPPSGVYDDDEAYWAAVGGVTREDLAEALARHEREGSDVGAA